MYMNHQSTVMNHNVKGMSVNYLSDSSKRPCCRGPAYDYVVNTLGINLYVALHYMHSFLFICQIQVFRDTLTVLLQNFLIHVRIIFSGIFFSSSQECSLVIFLFNNTSQLSLFSIVKLSITFIR